MLIDDSSSEQVLRHRGICGSGQFWRDQWDRKESVEAPKKSDENLPVRSYGEVFNPRRHWELVNHTRGEEGSRVLNAAMVRILKSSLIIGTMKQGYVYARGE